MSGNILDRYAPRPSEVLKKQDEESPEDLGAFGILRGVKEKAIMLECRHANGNSSAFSYNYLSYASFDPSLGILLQFGGTKLRITGDHLNQEVRPNVRLYESILRHRVLWIREASQGELDAAQAQRVLIDGMEIEA